MKIKGISMIEQHIEKIVLLVALLGLGFVVTWQLAGRPNRVPMGAEQVDPAKVDQILKERADALSTKLADDARPDTTVFSDPTPRVANDFANAIKGLVSDGKTLARLSPSISGGLQPVDLGTDTWYHQPALAAPAILPNVLQTADALTDEVVSKYAELQSRFPDKSAPKDIVWTTPAAVIEPKLFREELRRANASQKPARVQIPTPWYNDSVYVVDVAFEREELQANGSFASSVIVETIPGQTTFRPRLNGQADASLSQELFQRLGDRPTQTAVIQPDFLPTRNNAFVPPALPTQGGGVEENEQVASIKELLTRLRAERTKKNDELTKLGGPLEDQPKEGEKPPGDGKGKGKGEDEGSPPGGIKPPGAPGDGLSGGGGFGKDKNAADKDSEANKKRRIALTKELRRLDDRIGKAETELKAIAPNELLGAAASAGGVDLAGDQPVLVWAHDIGVKPGKTYRYRSVVKTYNPFFARKRQLVKEQASLSEMITLDTVVSAWSAPVEVTPPVAFFLTRANPGDGPMGLGTARFEVYRLHDGKWRLEEFTVGPGDRIGRPVDGGRASRDASASAPKDASKPAAPGVIDYSTDWYVVDVIEDQTADRKGLAEGQKAAIVVLERVGGGRTEVRDPQRDVTSPDRRRLNRDYKLGA